MSGVAGDFERIADYFAGLGIADIASRIHEIIYAIAVLEYNRLIGGSVEGDKRERVIGHDARGETALYG